jgi:hypothetical protein
VARQDKGRARCGKVRQGEDCFGFFLTGLGPAWYGKAGRGLVRRGTEFILLLTGILNDSEQQNGQDSLLHSEALDLLVVVAGLTERYGDAFA